MRSYNSGQRSRKIRTVNWNSDGSIVASGGNDRLYQGTIVKGVTGLTEA